MVNPSESRYLLEVNNFSSLPQRGAHDYREDKYMNGYRVRMIKQGGEDKLSQDNV